MIRYVIQVCDECGAEALDTIPRLPEGWVIVHEMNSNYAPANVCSWACARRFCENPRDPQAGVHDHQH